MESRKITHAKRNLARRRKSAIKRLFLVTLTVLLMLSGGIIFTSAEYGMPIKDIPKLKQVGPIGEYGFPAWYRDSQGNRSELCLDFENPLCALPIEEIPNPAEPFSIEKGNFPEEAFYQLAGAEIDLPGGGRAVATFALEAAWANEIVQEGDQIVFGRVRFRIDGLVTGGKYTITHPYGIDTFTAVAADERDPSEGGEIRFVEDIGVQDPFDGPMKSRIGTFLRWDPKVAPAAPEGYVGDPDVNHKIIGGVNGQNYFKIQGPGLGANCGNDCSIETDEFSLSGKIAQNSGVDVARATYSRNVDTDGNTIAGGTIDVFAFTEEDKDYTLQVTGAGDKPIPMKGKQGKYYARVSFTSDTPPVLTITNTTDNPDSVKTVTPVDMIVEPKAIYRSDQKPQQIIITASSSDIVNKPELKIPELGNQALTDGRLVIESPSFIPPYITINSAKNGTVTIPVEVVGAPANPPVADAGSDQTVKAGDLVTLNGSKSVGDFDTNLIKWEFVSSSSGITNVDLKDANTLAPSFTAEQGMGTLKFKLILTGPNGDVNESTVKVTVEDEVVAPEAMIVGPNEVPQGKEVILDASGSKNAVEYIWEQTAGPKATLNTADPIKLKFTYPKENKPVTIQLTVKGVDGTLATKEVTINTKSEAIAITGAEYRSGEWRIDGTSDVKGPGVTVTIYLGDPSGNKIIAKATVDTLGAWRYRGTGAVTTVPRTGNVTATSPTSIDVPSLAYRFR
ncbi:PKD domain-containing protein [Bacillus sp. X1(2014)]|uniref:PKD domain-containing protein n=1 Tax=Bacillus sp. X1(2014) TaxID=1565991 RepID=UPI00119D6A88|nr:hypothetical protein [Bacillus sp. X1(2014)]